MRRIYSTSLGDDPAEWGQSYRDQFDDPSMPVLEIRVGSATVETYEPVD